MNISLLQASQYMFAAESVVITGHIHPDGDCLGSMLALFRLFRQKGIKARLLLDDEIPTFYAFLPDLQAIERPVAPIEADLLIVLDASDIDRIGRVRECVSAPVLNLDHHISNTGFADYLFLDSSAAATGSILYTLFRQEGIKPDELTATCLYTAIATDCGFFRYANTTSDTLRYAAELLDCGVQPALVSEALETKPSSSIFTLIQVLETLELALDGKVACVTVSPGLLETGESTDDFINYPRSIEGVEIAIMFKQTDPSFTRISLRSRNVDVSAIALSFGGGGHKRAAGCSIDSPLDEAKRKIFVAVANALKEER
jgi:phosphoesterase RecJ-like protein